jgi:hypothetical protein
MHKHVQGGVRNDFPTRVLQATAGADEEQSHAVRYLLCHAIFFPVLSCAIGNAADGLIRPGQVSTAEMMLRFIDILTGINEDRCE